MVFKKRELVDYVSCHIQAQPNSDHVREIKDEVFPRLLSMEHATNAFGGQDETVLENAGAEESVADDAVSWVSATQDHKDIFVQTLSPISAALAELLYKVWGGEYDEEMSTLAGQSLQGPSKPWYKYLEATEDKVDDGGERSPFQEQ